MKFDRKFQHKSKEGVVTDFGIVAVEYEAVISLNGNEMGERSVEHLIHYAMQSLQDQYAGVGTSKTVAEATAAFTTRLDKLVNGTIGIRSGTGGVDPLTTVMRSIARKFVKAKLSKAEYKEKYTDNEDKNDYLDSVIDKKPETFESAGKAELARMAKEANDIAGLDVDLSDES